MNADLGVICSSNKELQYIGDAEKNMLRKSSVGTYLKKLITQEPFFFGMQ